MSDFKLQKTNEGIEGFRGAEWKKLISRKEVE
jgi:hypothetical protein